MHLLAPAKINLHLRVGRRRDDGFHPLLTWMCTVGLFDSLKLEVIPAAAQARPPGGALPAGFRAGEEARAAARAGGAGGGETAAGDAEVAARVELVICGDGDRPDLPRDGSNLVARIATAFVDELRRERRLGRGSAGGSRGPAFREEGFQGPGFSAAAWAAPDGEAGSTASAGAAPTNAPGTGREDPAAGDRRRDGGPDARRAAGTGAGAVRDAEGSGRSNRREGFSGREGGARQGAGDDAGGSDEGGASTGGGPFGGRRAVRADEARGVDDASGFGDAAGFGDAGGVDDGTGLVHASRVVGDAGVRGGFGEGGGSGGPGGLDEAEGGWPPVVRVTLDKRVPIGAGLGGGSSDAAHTLVGLNRLLSAGWSAERLAGFSGRFGSDVPFFVYAALGAASAACRGRGEVVRPVRRPAARWAVIFSPPFGMATRDVYGRFDAMGLGFDAELGAAAEPAWERWAELPARELLERLVNDLEAAAFSVSPELAGLRETLERDLGRVVRMSGSGSSLFTLFDEGEEPAARVRPLPPANQSLVRQPVPPPRPPAGRRTA